MRKAKKVKDLKPGDKILVSGLYRIWSYQVDKVLEGLNGHYRAIILEDGSNFPDVLAEGYRWKFSDQFTAWSDPQLCIDMLWNDIRFSPKSNIEQLKLISELQRIEDEEDFQ